MNAGLLGVLPVPGNPVVRDWYVMHLASRQLPQVALAFEDYLRTHGQAQIKYQLGTLPAARPAAKKRAAKRAA